MGVSLGFEFRRGLLKCRDGWMDTGGARECVPFTGDTGLVVEPVLPASRQTGSLWRTGNCCDGPVAGVVLLLPLWDPFDSCGLAEAPFRRWIVELLDVGEAACEANVSTWSIEWPCHPWLTLTIAYESLALSSAESCDEALATGDQVRKQLGTAQLGECVDTYLSNAAPSGGGNANSACIPRMTTHADR